ncbi:HET-domain-containing protein [Xylariomycetidae sp. FL2044]|nr:HET-domain-containing protein [Xylariomycetidae sp. FL2044]
MRLINTTTLELHEFVGRIPRYAVLSHRWGTEEVSYQEMLVPSPATRRKEGFYKIRHTCDQALRDRLDWAWVDTCCIDKSSSAELSESINSMFKWYRHAQVCYAYLRDVKREDTDYPFHQSQWFTRGWTLQELLAPRYLEFYDVDWTLIGDKFELASEISLRAGIRQNVITSLSLDSANVAEKMSWAAKRRTTRLEDEAYCLLGIFDVNMPLLYGEGIKAFARLQEEILKSTYDPTIFAWGLPPDRISPWPTPNPQAASTSLRGLLAKAPREFAFAHSIEVIPTWPNFGSIAPIFSSRGVRLVVPLLHLSPPDHVPSNHSSIKEPLAVALLGIRPREWGRDVLGIILRRWQEGIYGRRDDAAEAVAVRVPVGTEYEELRSRVSVIDVKEKQAMFNASKTHLLFSHKVLHSFIGGYSVDTTIIVPPVTYDPVSRLVELEGQNQDMSVAFIYSNGRHRFALCFYVYPQGAFKYLDLSQHGTIPGADPSETEVSMENTRSAMQRATTQAPTVLRMPEFRLRNYLSALAIGEDLVDFSTRYFMPYTIRLNNKVTVELKVEDDYYAQDRVKCIHVHERNP